MNLTGISVAEDVRIKLPRTSGQYLQSITVQQAFPLPESHLSNFDIDVLPREKARLLDSATGEDDEEQLEREETIELGCLVD